LVKTVELPVPIREILNRPTSPVGRVNEPLFAEPAVITPPSAVKAMSPGAGAPGIKDRLEGPP